MFALSISEKKGDIKTQINLPGYAMNARMFTFSINTTNSRQSLMRLSQPKKLS
jgi:hypothetical protein